MKKEEIYVRIKSEDQRLRVLEILRNAGDKIYKMSKLLREFDSELTVFIEQGEWVCNSSFYRKQITIDQLEELLNPSYVVKEVVLSIEELKSQAEKLGYTLQPKPYEPKVGDFGAFWDINEGLNNVGFLTGITNGKYPYYKGFSAYKNFRKLTEKEKQLIQESW